MILGGVIALVISLQSPSIYADYLFNGFCLGITGIMVLLFFKEKSLWIWLAVAAIAIFANSYFVVILDITGMDYSALLTLLNLLVLEAFVILTAIFLFPDSKKTT